VVPWHAPTLSASGWGGEAVIAAALDQRRHRKAAVAEQFLAVAERHHIVGPKFFPVGP